MRRYRPLLDELASASARRRRQRRGTVRRVTVDHRRPLAATDDDGGRPSMKRRAGAMERLERLDAGRRISRWDRPPPPHDWRWAVGMVGKVLIATGILMFGFVAYQLWGTGIEYAQAQDELDEELDVLLSPSDASTVPGTAPPATATPSSDPTAAGATTAPTAVAPLPSIELGAALARLEIPTLGVDAAVVEGVGREDLKRGPGHYPGTPIPGQLGNAAIAGHRSTYGAPFADLDAMEIGDRIIVTTAQGRYVYRMTAMDIVGPTASEVISTTDPNVARLTLTTCHPRYSAQSRLIVFAELDVASSAVPAPYVPAPPPPELASEDPAADVATGLPANGEVTPDGEVAADDVTEETADAFAQGWFSDEGAFPQVALWGSLLTLISLGAYALSRAVRSNLVGALVGIVPFVVVAYFFFQNVNRLLPAAL
jgi:sortase A